MRVNSREQFLGSFAGKRIAFIGDSITRYMAWELATWAWGCSDEWASSSSESNSSWPQRFANYGPINYRDTRYADNLGTLCDQSLRDYRTTPVRQTLLIPTGPAPSANDAVVAFEWSTFAWTLETEVVKALLLTGPEAPDVIIANSAFWHFRSKIRDPPCRGDPPKYQGLLCSVDHLIATLDAFPPSVRAKERFLWRGNTLIEKEEGGMFTNAAISAADDVVLAKFLAAGYAVVPVRHITPSRHVTKNEDLLFTKRDITPSVSCTAACSVRCYKRR